MIALRVVLRLAARAFASIRRSSGRTSVVFTVWLTVWLYGWLSSSHPHHPSAWAHLDTAPAWNGVATSSSPFQSRPQGDEDIATPFPFSNGAVSRCAPSA
jgi:hypothetical protein